jgi:V8-like Glu-specific endopeptidase
MAKPLSHQDRTVLLYALADTDMFSNIRGRQAIVRNALGGYPHSRDLNNALRFLNWDGESVVVADQLLRLLDGQEAAPGVPALGLIAQAIEPMAGEHRDKVVELRKRLLGSADSAPSPDGDWRDQRPTAEIVKERIIGENTLRPLYYLRRALRAADAVVRIDSPTGKGTGFLLARDLMITNHHVIANEQQARSAQVVFFDEVPDTESGESPLGRAHVVVHTAENPLLHTSEELDYTLVRLRESPALSHYLPVRPRKVEQNQRVAIIQHAGGEPKRVSLQNNLVAHCDERLLQYYTTTLPGSSGSPVFDDEFAVVAIHHSSVASPQYKGEHLRVLDPKQLADTQYRNQGTSMIAILDDLKKQRPELVSELTIRG